MYSRKKSANRNRGGIFLKKKKTEEPNVELSVQSVAGEPETSYEMLRKYGTYEIQPTADTKHDFPTVAQGLSENAEKPTKASKHKKSK
jgi:hypothetical protein